MLLLAGFAFLAGIVTILSPCILPVLPIVLSGSVSEGRARPWGVVVGFVASFTFFTLFLTTIVRATGLPTDILRGAAVIIIAGFGLTLILPAAQALIEKGFARLSGLVPTAGQRSGFGGGIVIGISLGLVWTPCVGPILAAVISLALTGTVTATAILITLAYSAGTAIPMLAIIYGGQAVLSKNRWLITRSAQIQKGFGLVMILTAGAIYFGLDRQFQTYILKKFPNYGVGLTKFEDNSVINQQLEELMVTPEPGKIGKPMSDLNRSDDYGAAPELIVGGEWFNLPNGKKSLTLTELKGQVVLVDFWTYTCINCIRTLPYLVTWHEKYAEDGLVIVGVHTPEFEFEKETDNVAKAIKDYGLKYVVMQDNEYATWRAYQNRFWPAKYLVDRDGRIRYRHFGEGAYDETESMIQKLLGETGTEVSREINNPSYLVQSATPELYVGSARYEPGYMKFGGDWIDEREYRTAYKGARLELEFKAREVFVVMRPGSVTNGRVQVNLDGESVGENAGEDVINGQVTVNADRLYKIINLPGQERHRLELEFVDNPIQMFAFTFG